MSSLMGPANIPAVSATSFHENLKNLAPLRTARFRNVRIFPVSVSAHLGNHPLETSQLFDSRDRRTFKIPSATRLFKYRSRTKATIVSSFERSRRTRTGTLEATDRFFSKAVFAGTTRAPAVFYVCFTRSARRETRARGNDDYLVYTGSNACRGWNSGVDLRQDLQLPLNILASVLLSALLHPPSNASREG